jgi:hypothetical protein
MRLRVYMCESLYDFPNLCVYEEVRSSECNHIICATVNQPTCLCACVRVHVCVCASVYICVCVRACMGMCVCVRARVCVCLRV